MFNRIPGTKDILPEEASSWQALERISRAIFSLYNYAEIRPPLIEQASLFDRSLGEFAEIVQKQMFLIKNREDVYALRPEATASVVRAYIENNLEKTAGFSKLYYIGPMFRLERPQKGRLRQFHHIGCEAIGSSSPLIDVEIISLAHALLTGLGIEGHTTQINSLGCAKDKLALTQILHKELKSKINGFCDECQLRFKHNILRILDCKKERCIAEIKKIERADTRLCQECQEYFAAVKSGLDTLHVLYEVSPLLVRGLDYYTRTVFEVRHASLGAQDAIGAGGRYDALVKELGGPDIGAMGFAFGVERLFLALKQKEPPASKNLVYVIPLGREAGRYALTLLADLRNAGIVSDTDYENKSLKGAMRKANDLGARFAVILGENELKKKVITVKDMAKGEQREVDPEAFIKELKC